MTAELPPAVEADVPYQRSKALSSIIEIATTIGMAVVLYLIITTFVVQTYQVQQVSMLDTLQPNQHLLIDKLTPRFDDYSRGDIIVFHPPDTSEGDIPYIKRIIGVGGDHVEIHDGAVWVNGAKLDEPYVNPKYKIEPGPDQSAWDVPVGSLFVMGDHRDRSTDSRYFGTVPVSSVIGRAVVRIWPLSDAGILQTPTYPNVPPASSPAPGATATP